MVSARQAAVQQIGVHGVAHTTVGGLPQVEGVSEALDWQDSAAGEARGDPPGACDRAGRIERRVHDECGRRVGRGRQVRRIRHRKKPTGAQPLLQRRAGTGAGRGLVDPGLLASARSSELGSRRKPSADRRPGPAAPPAVATGLTLRIDPPRRLARGRGCRRPRHPAQPDVLPCFLSACPFGARGHAGRKLRSWWAPSAGAPPIGRR